jgi:hypothetical protein
VNPNRISSSGRDRPDRFKLDQPPWPVLLGRHRTAVNCNPNYNPSRRLAVEGLPDLRQAARADDLRITSVRQAASYKSTLGLTSGSLRAVGDGCWLLTAVRGQNGGMLADG